MYMRNFFFTLLFLALAIQGKVSANDQTSIKISDGWDLKEWKKKVFSNATEYTAIDSEFGQILKASTDKSASVLYKKIKIDLTKTPYLNWSWKVENVYPITEQQSKKGDDFPARVYVILREGPFPWQALSLNYVWSSMNEQAEFWPNPFTEKAVMIPVQSGKQGLQEWKHYKKDIRKDFLRVFNKDISKIHGIAIMADSDNSMGKATSYFGDIYFSSD